MDKFCALSLSLLLCLSGCKDSENKLEKNRISKTSNKINSQKSSLDEAKFWELTNLETLGMTLDLTTKEQAIDILNSHGYTAVLPESGVLEKVGLAELYGKSLKKWFAKDLPSTELLDDGIKSLQDRLKKSSIIFAGNMKFQGKWDDLNLVEDPNVKKNFMIFIFDENKKLIIFFKQYPENKEAGLVIYEVMKKAAVNNMGEKKPTYIFEKDQSFSIIEKRDLKATSYIIFAPSIVGKYVGAFNKTCENVINTKEFKELSEKEKEYLKGLERK